MPTYDYQCRSCGSTTEVIHSMLEDGPSVCERCGGALRRVIFPSGIIFKGSGFYRNDSRASSSSSSGGSESGSSSDSDGAKSKSDESKAKTDGASDSTSAGDSSAPGHKSPSGST